MDRSRNAISKVRYFRQEGTGAEVANKQAIVAKERKKITLPFHIAYNPSHGPLSMMFPPGPYDKVVVGLQNSHAILNDSHQIPHNTPASRHIYSSSVVCILQPVRHIWEHASMCTNLTFSGSKYHRQRARPKASMTTSGLLTHNRIGRPG